MDSIPFGISIAYQQSIQPINFLDVTMKYPFRFTVEHIESSMLSGIPRGSRIIKQYLDGSERVVPVTGPMERGLAVYTARVLGAAVAEVLDEEGITREPERLRSAQETLELGSHQHGSERQR